MMIIAQSGGLMKSVKKMLLVFIGMAAFLNADYYLKYQMHVKPNGDSVQEQWIGKEKIVTISQDTNFIIDMSKKKVFIVTHKDKSYVETDYPVDFSKLLDFPEESKAILSMMKITVTVNATGQKKKIGKWNCDEFQVNMTMMGQTLTNQVWATKDLPIDWKRYSDLAGMMLGSIQTFMDTVSIAEFKKIEGITIESEFKGEIMGNSLIVSNKIVELTQKEAPAGIYSPPPGYKKVEKLSMPGAMN